MVSLQDEIKFFHALNETKGSLSSEMDERGQTLVLRSSNVP